MKITIKTGGVAKAISSLSATLADMTPIMQQVAGEMLAALEKNFDTEGARLGEKWKQSERAKTKGGLTLQDTGGLASSMVKKVTPNSAEVGTNWGGYEGVPGRIAMLHNFGGVIVPVKAKALRYKVGDRWVTAKKVTMPKREFMALNAQDRKEIISIIKRGIKQSAK